MINTAAPTTSKKVSQPANQPGSQEPRTKEITKNNTTGNVHQARTQKCGYDDRRTYEWKDRQTVGTKCEFLECSKVVPPDFTQAQKRQTNIFEEAVGP